MHFVVSLSFHVINLNLATLGFIVLSEISNYFLVED
jgi:hypothetical protein